MGLSGLGDLVLTATGDLSRNRRVGLLLAAGDGLPAILQRLGHVGRRCGGSAPTVDAAGRAWAEMPIKRSGRGRCSKGRLSTFPAQALQRLMGREARSESG